MPTPAPTRLPPATLEAVRRVLDAAPARLGPARLLSLDGPSGSGKTSAADHLVTHLRTDRDGGGRDVRLLHVEDHYEGWGGLGEAPRRVADLLTDLAAGRPGRFRSYDWGVEAFADEQVVAPLGPGSVVVLEGVGAGAAALRRFRSALVWIEAPRALRLRRGLERDGAHLEPQLRAWSRSEDAHFAAQGTRAAADLRLDAYGRLPSRPGR